MNLPGKMRDKANGERKTIYINRIGYFLSTTQRSNSLRRQLISVPPKIQSPYGYIPAPN